MLNDMFLLTSKSSLHLVNMSKPDFLRQKNKWLPKIKQWIEENRPGEKMVFYSATLEAEFLEMDAEAKEKFCVENKTRSQIGKIVIEVHARAPPRAARLQTRHSNGGGARSRRATTRCS